MNLSTPITPSEEGLIMPRVYNLYALNFEDEKNHIITSTVCLGASKKIKEVINALKTFHHVHETHYEINEDGELACIEFRTHGRH